MAVEIVAVCLEVQEAVVAPGAEVPGVVGPGVVVPGVVELGVVVPGAEELGTEGILAVGRVPCIPAAAVVETQEDSD